jgi:predicted DNA-binding transcriptional regulator AlpA
VQQRFLRLRDLASTPDRNGKPGRKGRYPASGASIWRWSADDSTGFPKPVKLGPGTTAWRVDELDAWDAKRSQESDK